MVQKAEKIIRAYIDFQIVVNYLCINMDFFTKQEGVREYVSDR